jgi:hypothetical protein
MNHSARTAARTTRIAHHFLALSHVAGVKSSITRTFQGSTASASGQVQIEVTAAFRPGSLILAVIVPDWAKVPSGRDEPVNILLDLSVVLLIRIPAGSQAGSVYHATLLETSPAASFFARLVAKHIIGPMYKDFWTEADTNKWGEPGPMESADEVLRLLEGRQSRGCSGYVSDEPLSIIGAGPGAELMAFFIRAAGISGCEEASAMGCTALQTEEERVDILQRAIRDGLLPSDKAAPILCVCGGGPCAYSTRRSLTRLGYNNVANTILHNFFEASDMHKSYS